MPTPKITAAILGFESQKTKIDASKEEDVTGTEGCTGGESSESESGTSGEETGSRMRWTA